MTKALLIAVGLNLLIGAFVFLLLSQSGYGYVNVFFSSAAPTNAQSDFIASATNQFNATLVPSLFSGNWNMMVHGPNPNYIPPQPSSPIADATAFDRCFSHGWVFGSENERKDILKILDGLRDDLFLTQTCGGTVASSTVPYTAYLEGCWSSYNITTSTVSQRDGLILVPPIP